MAKKVEVERRRLTEKETEAMRSYYRKLGNLSEVIEKMQEKYNVHVSNGNAWIICTEAGQKWRKQGGKSDKKLASEKSEKRGHKGKTDKGKTDKKKNVSSNKKASALAKLKGKTKK